MDLAELQLGKKLQHMENQPYPKDFIEPQLGKEPWHKHQHHLKDLTEPQLGEESWHKEDMTHPKDLAKL